MKTKKIIKHRISEHMKLVNRLAALTSILLVCMFGTDGTKLNEVDAISEFLMLKDKLGVDDTGHIINARQLPRHEEFLL